MATARLAAMPDTPDPNRTRQPRGLHIEIMQAATRDVWLAQAPIEPGDFEALEVPEGWVKSGAGRGAMDRARFRRSPGAESDVPVDEIDLVGTRSAHVARAQQVVPPEPGQPVQILVEKHHDLGCDAGRELRIPCLPDSSEYVEQIHPGGAAETPFPPGWSLGRLQLREPLDVCLPCPVACFFFANGASFAGPLDDLP